MKRRTRIGICREDGWIDIYSVPNKLYDEFLMDGIQLSELVKKGKFLFAAEGFNQNYE